MMTRLMTLLAISLVASACGTTPPVGEVCRRNQSAANPYDLCFRFESDFDQDLSLKPGAKGRKQRPLYNMQGRYHLDETSLSNLRAWAEKRALECQR
jgi:sirohydrochlorin ferrochelatase